MAKVSIVIPTLNAAAWLRRSLPPLADFGALDLIREAILADGGSTDETAAIAEAAGARLVRGETGRGLQLAAGAAAARGDWLLFLHADTVLQPGWDTVVRGFIESPANAGRAAYFRFALDDARIAARRIAWLTNLRCRVLGLPYGDQGLLIARDFFNELGGYAPLPLMEDVDLVRRIGRRRLAMLDAVAVTSAARYRRDGFWLRPLRNQLCLALWFLGVPPRAIMRIYER
ncbi:MAG: TIGR04283 family arsenosugar biosynthesis glycosyltransferase [Alphaproteobacteria bacterium]|nr:TIGR04283 family arsenosugar biosynthesis glycosyltransferase [Alphaproteobacteria bacterium]